MKKMSIGLSLSLVTIVLLSVAAMSISAMSVPAAAQTSVTVKYSPALLSTTGANLNMFVTGSDGNVYFRTSADGVTWSGTTFSSLGAPTGGATSSPTAVQVGSTIVVYVCGTDGSPYSTIGSGSPLVWTAWHQETGKLLTGTGPSAINNGGPTTLFVAGTDRAMWVGTVTSGGITWVSKGGILISSPSAVATTTGVTAFVTGTDHAVWMLTETGTTWGGWSSAGGRLLRGTGPSAYSLSNGRVGTEVAGTNGALYDKYWQGTSAVGWTYLGGVMVSSPGATATRGVTAGTVDVMVVGSPSVFTSHTPLYQKTYTTSAGWDNWKYVAGTLA